MNVDIMSERGYGLGNPKPRDGSRTIYPTGDSKEPIGRFRVIFVGHLGGPYTPVVKTGEKPIEVTVTGRNIHRRTYHVKDPADVEKLKVYKH